MNPSKLQGQASYIKVNGKMANRMALVSYSSTMVRIITALLIKALFMGKADLYQALRCITKDRLEGMLLRGLASVLTKGKIMCIMVNG